VKTVGAWVREQFEELPQEEDTFVWRDLTVTITEVEHDRIQFVEVKRANPLLDAVTARSEREEA
jgi:CBS domain containing-hemolysin-like protein